jgi:hypothetical protein
LSARASDTLAYITLAPAYTEPMRWKWRVDPFWGDLGELPWPLALFFGSSYSLALVRDVVVYLLTLAVAVACIVIGTTLAHYVGAVLVTGCVLVALRFVRRHLTWRSS